MSYYDYYGGYGAETDKDQKPPKQEMDKDEGKSMPPAVVAYMLVPIFEGINWYVTNDKWGSVSNSDWDNVTMSFLAKAGLQTVSLVGVLAMPSPMTGKIYMNLAGLSAVWGLANGYLLYAANDSASSDNNSTKIASALTAVNTVVSGAAYMAMKSKGKDWEKWGKKGDEKRPPKDDKKDDAYGGYGYDYGYSYY